MVGCRRRRRRHSAATTPPLCPLVVVQGFFDYGPPGCAMKQNVTQEWRNHFILEENMLEVCAGRGGRLAPGAAALAAAASFGPTGGRGCTGGDVFT